MKSRANWLSNVNRFVNLRYGAPRCISCTSAPPDRGYCAIPKTSLLPIYNFDLSDSLGFHFGFLHYHTILPPSHNPLPDRLDTQADSTRPWRLVIDLTLWTCGSKTHTATCTSIWLPVLDFLCSCLAILHARGGITTYCFGRGRAAHILCADRRARRRSRRLSRRRLRA